MIRLDCVGLVKTAGPLDWIQENPGWAATIAGALGGGGALARRLMRNPSATTSALQKTLRGKAREGGLHFVVPQRVAADSGVPTRAESLRARLTTLGERPIHLDPYGETMPPAKGVTIGVSPERSVPSPAEITSSGLGTHSDEWSGISDAMERINQGGKPFEQGAELGLGSLFSPGQALSDVVQKYKLGRPAGQMGSPERSQYLNTLQEALRKEFGQGFVLKPHGLTASSGAFPTESGKWGDLYQDYYKRLRPEMDRVRREAGQGLHGDRNPDFIVASKFRKDPAFPGMQLDAVLRDPRRALAQQKLDLVKARGGKPYEYRVHALGGEVPPELSYNRYMPKREALRRLPLGGLLPSKRTGTSQEAAEWVQQNVMPKLPEKYRKGTFGFDVARVRNPDGSYGYKLVELNPTAGGSSGFLDPSINPMITQDATKWVTGQDAAATTAAKMIGYGGAAAGGTGLAAKATQPEPTPWEGPVNRLRGLRSRLFG